MAAEADVVDLSAGNNGDHGGGMVEEQEEDDNLYCICLKKDDGRPLIQCEGCQNWWVELDVCGLVAELGHGLPAGIISNV